MIKKFKNRKIVLDIREDLKSGYYDKNIQSVENFYHHEMFMSDLYINLINGYPYIVDYNTQTVYDLPRNDFQLFLEDLIKQGKIVLEPYGKRMSKSLLKDLEKQFLKMGALLPWINQKNKIKKINLK